MNEMSYPDILRVLSDERLTIDDLVQCALGIFPPEIPLGQPVEALLLLQNLTDQALTLRLTIGAPLRDEEGRLINLFTPKPRLKMTLPASEAGLLHIPVVPQLPSQPGQRCPLTIAIDVEQPAEYTRIRPLEGGHAPNLLAISPVRVAMLHDVTFTAQEKDDRTLGAALDVLPGHLPPRDAGLKPHYETLWSTRDLEEEQAKAQAMRSEALRLAHSLSRGVIYPLLLDRTQDVFASAGIPLHDGEITFIVKQLTYVMENGLDLEEGFSLAGGRWFERLSWLAAHNPEVIPNRAHLINLLYSAVIEDAIMLGFNMVAHATNADFGSTQEQRDYAAKVVAALEGRLPLSLEHVYVPLVMAGVVLSSRLIMPDENPWNSLDMLVEARNGRASLASGALREVFDILDTLIAQAGHRLQELRITRD